MTAIENKEIRGMTARLFYTIITSTVTMVAGLLFFYYGLKIEIVEVKNQNEIRKIEMDALKIQVNSIQIQVNDLISGRSKEDKK